MWCDRCGASRRRAWSTTLTRSRSWRRSWAGCAVSAPRRNCAQQPSWRCPVMRLLRTQRRVRRAWPATRPGRGRWESWWRPRCLRRRKIKMKSSLPAAVLIRGSKSRWMNSRNRKRSCLRKRSAKVSRWTVAQLHLQQSLQLQNQIPRSLSRLLPHLLHHLRQLKI